MLLELNSTSEITTRFKLNISMLARIFDNRKMSDLSLSIVERESHMISIYTVLAISYTKMIRKKQFFSERD